MSLGDTELVLEGEFTPNNNQRLREIFSARGCADGCAYIEKELENDRKFTEDFIKDIHERTTLDCQPRIRGSYRIAPVYIQGSLTEPVSPIQIRELMPTLLYAYEIQMHILLQRLQHSMQCSKIYIHFKMEMGEQED